MFCILPCSTNKKNRPVAQKIAQTVNWEPIFSLWRTLSVRSLTDVSVESELRSRHLPLYESLQTALSTEKRNVWGRGVPARPPRRSGLAIDESSVILLMPSLPIAIDTPTKGRGGWQQNDSTLVHGYSDRPVRPRAQGRPRTLHAAIVNRNPR